MYELSEFEHCFICANNVGGRVRFTITEKTDVSTLLWNYAKINMAFQFEDVKFIVDYNAPDWDGAEEYVMRKMHDGFPIYVSEGEYPGSNGEILVYNKKPWLENGYGLKFNPGEKTPREIVNFLWRRMYSFR